MGRVHSASDVVLGLSGSTHAIRSCHQAHIDCESTGPLVVLLNWPRRVRGQTHGSRSRRLRSLGAGALDLYSQEYAHTPNLRNSKQFCIYLLWNYRLHYPGSVPTRDFAATEYHPVSPTTG